MSNSVEQIVSLLKGSVLGTKLDYNQCDETTKKSWVLPVLYNALFVTTGKFSTVRLELGG